MNKTVELLNAAFAKDPNAIHALLVNRYPCNLELANDPHIPVDVIPVVSGEHFQVGALGLINGILAANDMPLVAVKWSTESDSEGRSKMVGFVEYNAGMRPIKPNEFKDWLEGTGPAPIGTVTMKRPEDMTNEELMA